MSTAQEPADGAEVVALLQTMIRNGCVNDGTTASGHESRNVDVIADTLGTAGFDVEFYEPQPGRRSVVARIEGSDRTAPSLALVGHLDVVPVNPDGWSRDPFGGDIVDGEIWGRGALDMLGQTSAMAVTLARLARSGFAPRGTLVFAGVADEEAKSEFGMRWICENRPEAVAADYTITETGGIPMPMPGGLLLPVITGEKGALHVRLTVGGTPGHASQPYATDNALVTAAEVVRRLAEYDTGADLDDAWRAFVAELGMPDDVAAALLDPARIGDVLAFLPTGMAKQIHACTHTTIAPTIVHGGSKLNVIPDHVHLDLDIRTRPGHDAERVVGMLADALGDLGAKVGIEVLDDDPSTASPVETPLWDVFGRVCSRFHPDARVVPFLSVGATDARWARRNGSVGYGFALYSRKISLDDFGARFHGDDERIDLDSLALTADAYTYVARELLT